MKHKCWKQNNFLFEFLVLTHILVLVITLNSTTFAMENETIRGERYRSPLLLTMSAETIIEAVETLVQQVLTHIEATDVFLVSVKIKPTNNIKVYLDADAGLSIEKCVKINRAMYRIIEDKAWYPDGDFSLEVSSPGAEEPLKLIRQYKKNVGRKVAITLLDETQIEGKLLAATDQSIQIEQTIGKNKKAITSTIDIAFENIKSTKIIITF